MTSTNQDVRQELVGTTSRLVKFLRDLASAGRVTVRDVAKYEQVLWLDELPAEVVAYADAGPGDVITSFEPVASEPPPPLPEVLSGWVTQAHQEDSSLDAPELKPWIVRSVPRGARPDAEPEIVDLEAVPDAWERADPGGRAAVRARPRTAAA